MNSTGLYTPVMRSRASPNVKKAIHESTSLRILPGAPESKLVANQGSLTARNNISTSKGLDMLKYDRRLKSIGKAIKSNQIKDSEGTTMSPT